MQPDNFDVGYDAFQRAFHQRWNHLNDPHVRALAWLLDAPDLLDPFATAWLGKIATLSGKVDQSVKDWLARLDRDPSELHAALNAQHCARLGRYAEKLMVAYFQQNGSLVAHGVQVRAEKGETIGEFDFLLRDGSDLVHWEFATKFYLLSPSQSLTLGCQGADYFVGPNLADTLGAKMEKILNRQLALSQHPAAAAYLKESVERAQALVKGWLFYHDRIPKNVLESGVSSAHCCGYWCALSEVNRLTAQRYVILPRMNWLVPAKIRFETTLNKSQLQSALNVHFQRDTMPVLVASLEEHGDWTLEVTRGFVVPDDWGSRAISSIQT